MPKKTPTKTKTPAEEALPKVVSEKKFRSAVEKLRAKEKKNTRERDRLAARRRLLPMMEVRADSVFESSRGPRTLLELFGTKRQLIIYHFMYHPKDDSFCTGCSFVADHIPHLSHLQARQTDLVFVSHAPLKSIQRYQKRMGWTTPWYSSWKNQFNEELKIDGNREPALSVFLREGRKVYRTYYTGARGLEYLGTPWAFLDLTPWGRQEIWEDSPRGTPQTQPYTWWRRHDEYK